MKKFIVLFAVLVVVFAFSAQAMAEVSLYGSARFQTYVINSDKEVHSGTSGVTSGHSSIGPNPTGVYDDTDTRWRMDNLARWGAKFSAGDVGGLWEMDARDNTAASGQDTSSLGNLRIRHLYGTWNFGAGQLLIGQTWPVIDSLQSNLQYTDSGMQWYGGLGYLNARVSQLRLTFGNLMIGFITPQMPANIWATGAGTDQDVTLPKLELKYSLPLDPVTLNFMGGWQKYEEVNATDQSKDITSWVAAAQAKAKFGAAYVNFIINYAQNGGNYGIGASSVVDDAYMKSGGTTDIEDITTWGACLVAGFKVSDTVTLEAGYGKLKSDGDDFGAAGTSLKDEAQAYYANATVTMAPGVYIIPEFAIFDYEDIEMGATTTDQGKVTVIGVFWKIDFK